MSKLHVEHCAAESGSASPGGVASKAGAIPAALIMPGRICAISNKCSQICGLLSDFVIRSAICCFVLTYSMRTLGLAQTSNNHCTSILWVRGRWRRAMLRAFLTILITASLSSAMISTVVCRGFLVYANYFPRSNCSEYGGQFQWVLARPSASPQAE